MTAGELVKINPNSLSPESRTSSWFSSQSWPNGINDVGLIFNVGQNYPNDINSHRVSLGANTFIIIFLSIALFVAMAIAIYISRKKK